jgi:hypothetical protein
MVPGLMTGVAGIGYGLLRCYFPADVPSVLTLAPPAFPDARTPGTPATFSDARLASA